MSHHRLAKSHVATINELSTIAIPRDIHEALKDKRWKKAVMEEIEALMKNGTWDFVDVPQDKNWLAVGGFLRSNLMKMGILIDSRRDL